LGIHELAFGERKWAIATVNDLYLPHDGRVSQVLQHPLKPGSGVIAYNGGDLIHVYQLNEFFMEMQEKPRQDPDDAMNQKKYWQPGQSGG
jgi:hypothetical protein